MDSGRSRREMFAKKFALVNSHSCRQLQNKEKKLNEIRLLKLQQTTNGFIPEKCSSDMSMSAADMEEAVEIRRKDSASEVSVSSSSCSPELIHTYIHDDELRVPISTKLRWLQEHE